MTIEADLISEIEESRISIMASLRCSIILIKSECDEILTKIDQQGVNGYYSISSSLKSHCLRATKQCAELYYLKKWRSKIERYSKKQKTKAKKKKKEDAMGS